MSSERDDYVYWEEDDENHGGDCDCASCRYENAFDNCGRLPPDLGGGCSLAGSEDCDECPFHDIDFDEIDELEEDETEEE